VKSIKNPKTNKRGVLKRKYDQKEWLTTKDFNTVGTAIS
jgi:hypothetical protein